MTMAMLMRRLSGLYFKQQFFVCYTSSATLGTPTLSTPSTERKYVESESKHLVFTNVKGLEEFFDMKNFGKEEVKSGRSWAPDELRIKSNSDLHKLWYVLLKERNLLLTLGRAAQEMNEPMPNPERIDRVKISMENLESVIRERNRAFWRLEIGETGERPEIMKENWMGLATKRRANKHYVPQRYNKSFNEVDPLPYNDKQQTWFLNAYLEQRSKLKTRQQNKAKRHVRLLLRKYPNVDRDALGGLYPTVDIESTEDYLEKRE